jgi:acetyl-CoA carboxylase carboxyl transferase subunit alpha
VVTLVDTPGAYPGLDAEARGQAEAIASSIDTCLAIGVPLVSVVIGEGGSGGALAIASADKVFMLENAVYSVITPEGCASILWRSNANAQEAAEAMKVTAQDLKKLEVIDEVIPEPMGGAHRAPEETIDSVGKVISDALTSSATSTRHPAPTTPGQVPGDGQEGLTASCSPVSSRARTWASSPPLLG